MVANTIVKLVRTTMETLTMHSNIVPTCIVLQELVGVVNNVQMDSNQV